jgi:hypothetical protein
VRNELGDFDYDDDDEEAEFSSSSRKKIKWKSMYTYEDGRVYEGDWY